MAHAINQIRPQVPYNFHLTVITNHVMRDVTAKCVHYVASDPCCLAVPSFPGKDGLVTLVLFRKSFVARNWIYFKFDDTR